MLAAAREALVLAVMAPLQRPLEEYEAGRVDGALMVLKTLPGAGTGREELDRAALDAHGVLSLHGICGCGLGGWCSIQGTGLLELASRLVELTDEDRRELSSGWGDDDEEDDGWLERDDTIHCDDSCGSRREALDRSDLQARALETLLRARHELRAADIAEAIGHGVTGRQVGGALRSLARRGLVEYRQYRQPHNGFTVGTWLAAFRKIA